MKKVYIITKEEYSDYRIVGVLSDKNLAEHIAKKTEGKVEEWEVNTLSTDENYDIYIIRMNKKGDTVEISKNVSIIKIDETGFDVNNNMWTIMIAKDEKHAIKIANERRIKLLAENKWEYKYG